MIGCSSPTHPATDRLKTQRTVRCAQHSNSSKSPGQNSKDVFAAVRGPGSSAGANSVLWCCGGYTAVICQCQPEGQRVKLGVEGNSATFRTGNWQLTHSDTPAELLPVHSYLVFDARSSKATLSPCFVSTTTGHRAVFELLLVAPRGTRLPSRKEQLHGRGTSCTAFVNQSPAEACLSAGHPRRETASS